MAANQIALERLETAGGLELRNLTMRGGPGSILWGYRTAADITSWTVSRKGNKWKLVAVPRHVDRYQITQAPLIFSAPRVGGFWTWSIEGDVKITDRGLTAELGPPEQ